jgi:cytochrome P450
MSAELAQLTLEIVGRTLFSTELGRDADRLGPAIAQLLEWLNERSVNPLAPPLFIPTAANRRFSAARALIAQTVSELIAARRKAEADPGDLLSMLLLARDAETGEAMTDAQLQDEVMTFVIAGYETTSSALEWTLILLAQHPSAAERVRRESREVCGGRSPTPADLPRMPYTRMVIDEALRLYPPVFGLSRRVLQDAELGGYHVSKGMQVLVSPYALHRSPALWEDPDRFDPERFAPEPAAQRHRYAHVPFGAGPRQCIGNAFALMELQVIIPSLIGALHFELTEDADIAPQTRMTLRPRGPVRMRVRPV